MCIGLACAGMLASLVQFFNEVFMHALHEGIEDQLAALREVRAIAIAGAGLAVVVGYMSFQTRERQIFIHD